MAKAARPPSGKTFNGNSRDNVIVGTAYDDTIYGNGGSDTLTGGGGADTISGGSGGDTFRYLSYADSRATSGIDRITDFNPAEDLIDLTALGGAVLVSAYDPVRGGKQATLTYDGQQTILAWYDGGPSPVFELYLNGRHESLAGIAGITLPPPPPPPPEVVVGDAEVNEAHGTVTFTLVRSGAATATTSSTVGYASADGTAVAGLDYAAGSGTVTFAAGETVKTVTLLLIGDNAIEGIEDFSLLLSAVANANVIDSVAVATVTDDDQPTEGADNLTGTNAEDSVDLLGGDDVFDGRSGHDVIAGGSGDDVLLGGDGNDTLNGGDGNDTLYGQDGYFNTLNGGAGDDLMHISGLGLDTLDGGLDRDTLDIGNLGPGVSVHGFEDGSFEVRRGTLLATVANVEAIRGTGSDDLIDFQFSTAGIWVDGGFGADTLIGGSGADELLGGSGDDVLDGLSGADVLFGGEGSDLMFVADPDGEGTDLIDGGAGIDTVDFRDLPIGGLYVDGEFSSTVRVASMDWSRHVANVRAVEIWIGSMEADSFYLSGQTDALTIRGEGGDDNLYGGRGDDHIEGGSGDDWLGGYIGNDFLDGGEGTDWVSIGYSNYAAGGVTFTFQANGPDNPFVVTDDSSTMTLVNIEGVSFTGSAFNDVATGGSVSDWLGGFYGDDRLDGGAGDDTLYGDSGADVLIGGLGADQLMANADSETDTYLYFSLAESNVAWGIDTIDYASEDVIDLSQIDIDPETEGLQPGNWLMVGETYQEGAGAQATLAWNGDVGMTTLSLFQDDGDAIADFVLNLTGADAGVTILGVTYADPGG